MKRLKNGDSRVVPVKGLALTTLQDLASTHKSNPNYLEEYVFAIKKGGNPIDFRGSWKTALALSEIKNFTFHDIRHDYITALSSLSEVFNRAYIFAKAWQECKIVEGALFNK